MQPEPQAPAASAPTPPPVAPGTQTRRPLPPEATRWKKDQSGNPGGRPKGLSITAALRELLRDEHNGREVARIFAERMMKEALNGKFPFAKEVLERTEGRTVEHHQVEVRQRPWGETLDSLSDDDLMEMPCASGRADLLPPRLRMEAQRRTEGDAGTEGIR